MPQSLVYLPIHFVFSTKCRQPLIIPAIQKKLYAFMISLGKTLECPIFKINGMEDHVHILLHLSRTITVAKLVEKLKTESSKWMKKQGEDHRNFSWQKGYAAYASDKETFPRVQQYIVDQKEHHMEKNFKEESLKFLRYYGLHYDEKYLWD